MFDLHHHLLYGIDDGPRTLEESIVLARAAIENGITHVVCTPHASPIYPFRPELVEERLLELKSALAARELPLQLTQGCDFHLTRDNIEKATRHPERYTVNRSRYLLIELPNQFPPAYVSDSLQDLRAAGLLPILTHPERNATIQRDPLVLEEWVKAGLLLQITAGALLGRFGKRAQQVAGGLIKREWATIAATDAHNTTTRPPNMREAFQFSAAEYGQPRAERLFLSNPRLIYEDHALTSRPATESTHGQSTPGAESIRKLWGKLLRRKR